MDPYDLLGRLVQAFETIQIPYLVTGSVASMLYGEPRLTNDIDVVADIRPEHIHDLIAAFPESEYYIDEEMIREAIARRGQFNIIHPASGLKVDVILRRDTPFDASRFARIRRLRPAEQYEANFAAPEDVILKKLEFYRAGGSEKHLRDIAGMIQISDAEIDRDYIADWAGRLGVIDIWRGILDRLEE